MATTSALTVVENKIPNINSLVQKTDYDTKITEIEKKSINRNHDKYITTPKFNNLAARVFDAKSKQVDFITNTNLDTKLRSLN